MIPKSEDSLLKGWQAPPEATKPFVYWYWLNNIVTQKGITRDLEMMRKNGVGGAFIANIGGFNLDPPRNGLVKSYSEEGYGLLRHAVREGQRLGVQIGVFNGSGWSQSGGPWVKIEDAMQSIDCTEVRVQGGSRFNAILPRVRNAISDVRTIAFPAPSKDGEILKPEQLTSAAGMGLEVLADGQPHELPSDRDYGQLALTWEFAVPQTVRSVLFTHHNGNQVRGRLLYSQDGIDFKPLRDFMLDRRDGTQVYLPHRPSAVSTTPTTARFFRVEMPWHTGRDGRTLGIAFSGAARLEMAEEKQLGIASRNMEPPWDTFHWPSTPEPGTGSVAPTQVIDLTSQMSPDGRLNWNAPPGEWVVQRYSSFPTGERPNPTPEGMEGWEVDKLSKGAARRHIENGVVGQLFNRLKAEERSGLKYAIADSYECGFQNWTPSMIPDFIKRYGYDPTPWLPVFSGRIVGSAEQSDRFLWDIRRQVADMIAINYAGGMRETVKPYGQKIWLENYGHWGFPSEFGVYGGASDEIAAEFWSGSGDWSRLGEPETRIAAAAAHTYGKNLVWAEAFTAAGTAYESPSSIKARGDWAFAQGINRYMLHVNSHQPSEYPGPGLNLVWGTYFNRKTLWYAEHGKAWVDYVRRSCYLLQAGRPAADIAYFIGEDTPVMNGVLDPALPSGYDYDWINAEALLKNARVVKGRLVIPGGGSYALLAIPRKASIRPATLERIAVLVRQGLTVVGAAPEASPSLQDYPHADTKIKNLATSLWPKAGTANRKVGSGTVWRSTALETVLQGLKVGPPIIQTVPSVLWKQRTTPNAEIFFLSNQTEETLDLAPSFRVMGRIPELWNAATGSFETLATFRQKNGRTTVPVTLSGHQAIFIVFRKSVGMVPSVTQISKDGQPVLNWSNRNSVDPQETADSNLNQSFWIKPSGSIELPPQRLGGVTLNNQRWALVPLQGTFARGTGYAGTGVSVGTNGVAVIQHWSNNAPAVLVWQAPAPLTEWTHVLVSYRAGVPHLYINGRRVASGIRSGQRIVAGRPGLEGENVAQSSSAPDVEGVRTSHIPLSPAAIAKLAADRSDPFVASAVKAKLTRLESGALQLRTYQSGTYTLTLSNGRKMTSLVRAPQADLQLKSPWDVTFSGVAAPAPQQWSELKSWSSSSDETTKYFSGNATYTTSFTVPPTFKPGTPCTLDLGRVRIVARVAINNKVAGTAMVAPYALEVGHLLRPGRNTLKVLVTNTWANRLIGDEQFPDDVPRDGGGTALEWPEWAFNNGPRPEPRRVTLSSRRFVDKGTPLPPSGLIGPVTLKFATQVNLDPKKARR